MKEPTRRATSCASTVRRGHTALVAALVLSAACSERLADAGPPPGPESVADGVSRAESLAIIEQLGGWPPGSAPPASARCPAPAAPRVTDPAPVDARLDSLEQIALTADDPEQRIDAVVRVGNAGLDGVAEACKEITPPDVRHPGVVARLASLYGQLDDDRPRNLIITLMMGQSERTDAVAFLERLARDPVRPERRDEEARRLRQLLNALSRMGPQGRAALERLHAEGAVQEPAGRRYLDQLAKRGFREF